MMEYTVEEQSEDKLFLSAEKDGLEFKKQIFMKDRMYFVSEIHSKSEKIQKVRPFVSMALKTILLDLM